MMLPRLPKEVITPANAKDLAKDRTFLSRFPTTEFVWLVRTESTHLFPYRRTPGPAAQHWRKTFDTLMETYQGDTFFFIFSSNQLLQATMEECRKLLQKGGNHVTHTEGGIGGTAQGTDWRQSRS